VVSIAGDGADVNHVSADDFGATARWTQRSTGKFGEDGESFGGGWRPTQVHEMKATFADGPPDGPPG
jgi:hypothetical protein